jgi:hypothetical protein
MRRAVWTVVVLCAVAGLAQAAGSDIGTWAKTEGTMTLTIEAHGSARRLVYHVKDKPITLTVDSDLDGKDAPVMMNGKLSGETMAIRKVDAHHYSTVLKINGRPFGTSEATFSDDFSKMTVHTDIQRAEMGREVGKKTETWVRQ